MWVDRRCSASRSKGFCFLEYEDVLAAESAVQVLNGTPLANRTMRVGTSVMSVVLPQRAIALTVMLLIHVGGPTASWKYEPERFTFDWPGGDQEVSADVKNLLERRLLMFVTEIVSPPSASMLPMFVWS